MTTEPNPTTVGDTMLPPRIPPTPFEWVADRALPTKTSQPWYDTFISRNAKALAAIVIGGLTWGAVVVHSPAHAITAEEWLQLGGTLAAAVGVYGATNQAR